MKNNRRKIQPNEQLILHSEVDGICPLCPTVLIYQKNGNNQKGFEIAHIYPLNPLPKEIELLEDEERLSTDPDHGNNLICLCNPCHKRYDKDKTVKEYRELVKTKKAILKRKKEQSLWKKTNIQDEIFEIIDLLVSQDLDFEDNLDYNPKTIDKKTDSTITLLTKRKIHQNVQDHFFKIKEKFKNLDSLEPMTTEIISSQIKTHYLLLKQQGNNQKEIFDAMVEWLQKQTNQKNKDASEVIISYFVQNCEIF
ncbi:ABC-three component system protein [uncultured Christiangramia sp.]|uniref:ABC-three component system protein n=1 Tax=uncultured Christiangramia sp. TaxID=503836 RepID=UPI00260F1E42|nr:ABC-three component system protein [uncultured Christiangramia sp.]